jgi:hypothetical protein
MPDAKSHKTHYSQAKHNQQLEAMLHLKIIKVANKYSVDSCGKKSPCIPKHKAGGYKDIHKQRCNSSSKLEGKYKDETCVVTL